MVAVAVLAAVTLTRSADPPTSVVIPAPSTRPPSTRPPSTRPPSPSVPARPADAQSVTVRYVYDGDTLQLQARQPGRYVTSTAKVRVRLIGIDTPEVYPEAECFGAEAAARMRELAPVGSQVWVAPDRESFDRYGRLLFFVWTASGRLLNHELVAEGYAEAIRVRPNVTMWPLLQEAAKQAQAAQRGSWGAC